MSQNVLDQIAAARSAKAKAARQTYLRLLRRVGLESITDPEAEQFAAAMEALGITEVEMHSDLAVLASAARDKKLAAEIPEVERELAKAKIELEVHRQKLAPLIERDRELENAAVGIGSKLADLKHQRYHIGREISGKIEALTAT